MARSKRQRQDSDNSYWIGYTDLLSNSLLILLLTIAITTFAKANNEKPPLVRLTEEESFRFETGSYLLSSSFRSHLDQRIPEIRNTIAKYGIDSIEVIGHTDGQPSPGSSNLDLLLPRASQSSALIGYQAGSNVDLGLLRAVAVANYLRLKLDPQSKLGLTIRPYSAGSLIASDGHYAPADTRARAERRRIEVRFTRNKES
jgi:outer membrane protein OmpA-like peptidoglycan-associated protein